MSNKGFASRPFEKLKKQIERRESAASPPSPRRKKKEEYTDEELFNGAMQDVQEITDYRALSCEQHHPKPDNTVPPPSPDREALAALSAIASGELPINLPDTQEYVEWLHPDYQDTVIRNLHDGLFSVQTALDLHGFTVPEAEEELELFLEEVFAKGATCVKIIHGRGLRSVRGPRIKDAVIRRLLGKYRNQIIGFVSARQCDGGLGALYVLLARR